MRNYCDEAERKVSDILNDRDTSRNIADRVTGSYTLNGGSEVPVELREIYFDLWGENNAFFLTAISTDQSLTTKLIGQGLKAGAEYDITGEGDEPWALIYIKNVTYGEGVDFNRSSLSGGKVIFRFVEDVGNRKRVEGDFNFVKEYGRRGESEYSLNVKCNFRFSVTSREYPGWKVGN